MINATVGRSEHRPSHPGEAATEMRRVSARGRPSGPQRGTACRDSSAPIPIRLMRIGESCPIGCWAPALRGRPGRCGCRGRGGSGRAGSPSRSRTDVRTGTQPRGERLLVPERAASAWGQAGKKTLWRSEARLPPAACGEPRLATIGVRGVHVVSLSRPSSVRPSCASSGNSLRQGVGWARSLPPSERLGPHPAIRSSWGGAGAPALPAPSSSGTDQTAHPYGSLWGVGCG
jgi:hypothetical protein